MGNELNQKRRGASSLVVGLDAGGTRIRAVLATADDGRPVGEGASGPGNALTVPVPQLTEHLAEAVGRAVPESARARVVAVAGGFAGATGAADEPGRRNALAALTAALRRLGIDPGSPVIGSDIEAAFASAPGAPADGLALVAGTGAVGMRITDRRGTVTVDGDGWLLGDDGSGFWIGRAAVRAALRMADGRGAPTVLAEAVGRELGVPGDALPDGGVAGGAVRRLTPDVVVRDGADGAARDGRYEAVPPVTGPTAAGGRPSGLGQPGGAVGGRSAAPGRSGGAGAAGGRGSAGSGQPGGGGAAGGRSVGAGGPSAGPGQPGGDGWPAAPGRSGGAGAAGGRGSAGSGQSGGVGAADGRPSGAGQGAAGGRPSGAGQTGAGGRPSGPAQTGVAGAAVGGLPGSPALGRRPLPPHDDTPWSRPHREAYRRHLLPAVMAEPPIRLARLAPLVVAAAREAEDPVALAILDEAADQLTETVRALDPRPGERVVATGGLLGPDGPLTDRLEARLHALGLTLDWVPDGCRGAVALARLAHGGRT
ncbi:BadF/BadG/BcrA/BcrD ATPase family protein [Streptomyces swartbergensis]|uniref:BadF/BadG/BcrA/BcrD ATPase family protein n=1 Tax=Streptomyces swartbergensis TaxID=487165 RepID=UPI0038293187